MSAVQSRSHTDSTNPQFPFAPAADPQHPNTSIPRTMNPPHLGGQMPPQLNLYGGPQQHQHQQSNQPSQQQFQQQIPPQQHQHQQLQQPPQGVHPGLGMMPSGPGLVANNGGQQGLHQSQLQHSQQQRAMMQQRAALGNPQMPAAPGPFAQGQMRRISAGPQQPQNPPHMMGMPQNIATQLRPSGINARMLANQAQQPPPQGMAPDMPMAMNRHQQQAVMMNGLQQRTSSGGGPHQMQHLPQQQQQPPQQPPPQQQQQQQHRTPFQPQGPLPSPTRPSSHHSQTGTPNNGMGPATTAQRPPQTSPEHIFMNLQGPPPQQPPQQQPPPQQPPMFPGSAPGQQQQPSRQPFPFLPADSSESSPTRAQPFHITPAQQLQQLQQGQEPFAHGMIPHGQPRTAPSRPGPEPGPSRSPRPPSRHPPSAARPAPPPAGPPHMQPILPATSPHHRRGASAGGPSAPPEAPSLTQLPQQLLRPPMINPMAVVGGGQGLARLLGFSTAMANEKCDRLKYDHWNKIVTEYFTPQALWKLTLWKDNERREAKPFGMPPSLLLRIGQLRQGFNRWQIGPNVIAMLLLVSCQSGVRSMSFVLDGARERMVVPGTATIECPDAQWIWRFYDGHTIVLRGTFACQISAFHNRGPVGPAGEQFTLKFDSMNFDSIAHDRLISIDAIRGSRSLENLQKTPATTTQGSPDGASTASSAAGKADDMMERPFEPDPRVIIDHALLPQEPINAFGIPQASMRCLELAESVGQMTELFAFGWTQELGPQDALTKMGMMIRQQMGVGSVGAPAMLPGEGKQAVSLFGNGAGADRQPHLTQQPSQIQQQPQPPQPSQQPQQSQQPQSSQPVPPPQQQQPGGSMHSPQQPQQQPPTPTAAPLSKGAPSAGVSAPSGPTSLKRKAPQPPEAAEPPNKRVTRRKSKASGGG